jgi:hypothetical protein
MTQTKERERTDFIAGYFAVRAGEPDRLHVTTAEMEDAEAAFEKWWDEHGKLCDRCGRRNFMGQPMHVIGGRAEVCIDCFCFLTGMDERDPLTDPTARSGRKQDKPVVVASFAEFEQQYGPAERKLLRDSGVKAIPWWLGLLRRAVLRLRRR